ncbi:MAG TPA: hypothetical protein VJS47_01455 [Rhizomicrobium sp.]|nr:hypothetical protein [Rhizomicrobium sp.]
MKFLDAARRFSVGVLSLSLAGCAGASVLPLSADTLQISVSAAPICGASGANNVAAHRAAVETIRHGFDRFIVLGSQAQDNVKMIAMPSTGSTTVASGSVMSTPGSGMATFQGTSTTTNDGGGPFIFGDHDQTVIIKMFKDADPAGQNAVSARAALGEKWQEAVASKGGTCL